VNKFALAFWRKPGGTVRMHWDGRREGKRESVALDPVVEREGRDFSNPFWK
jgi:hypothetical protein